MPVTAINGGAIAALRPLSNFWTYWRVASEVMVLTNTNDNEQVQVENIRYHINSSISHLADILNSHSSPWYGSYLTCTLDAAHPSGLDYINLSSNVDVSRMLSHITRVSFPTTAVPVANIWTGNVTSWDIAQLTQQASQNNTSNRHTVAWAHNGNEILIFTGSDINGIVPKASAYYSLPTNIIVWAHRQPLLDDMMPVSTGAVSVGNTSATYIHNNGVPTISEYVDLPDKYIKLLIDLVQIQVLKQRTEPVPGALEQGVNAGLETLNRNLAQQVQYEAAEREKRKYGAPQRAPGTGA